MNRALIIVAVSLLLAGCVPSANGPDATLATATPTQAQVGRGPVEMVNTLRAQRGLSPVAVSRQLQASAQDHADDMTHNSYYSHASRNGDNERDRMQARGYSPCATGENIAWGQDTAQQVTQAWIDSPSHRANLLNPTFTHIGIAGSRAPDGPRDPIWVMVLAAREC